MKLPLKFAIASILIGTSAFANVPLVRATPAQSNTALTCRGTLNNRIDFTVSYQRQRGFYRAEFRPKRSPRTFFTGLRYVGRNRERRGVWYGNGSGNIEANVALVHLSAATPQRGDRVSMAYDGQWGRGTCL